MLESLLGFLSNDRFMPHGYCLQWEPALVWLHGLSDALIAVAYYSIPVTLVYFFRKRRNFPFSGVLLLFAAFILACGTTHLFEIWTLWAPIYGLEGIIKAVTAGVSVATAIILVPLAPKIIALPDPQELGRVNARLRREVRNRLRYERAAKARRRDLQRVASELLRAQEDTRAAIAQDLHDSVKQQISMLAIDIGMLAKERQADSPELARELMRIYESAEAATDSVREATQQLYPNILDSAGLDAALESLIADFGRALSIEIETDIHRTMDVLSKRKNLTLYRIAQEALQNIAKHAEATKVRVSLRASETIVRLRVEDNGHGFDLENARSGLGLGGMRERARAVDGRLSIVSRKGVGTRITVRVPVETSEIVVPLDDKARG